MFGSWRDPKAKVRRMIRMRRDQRLQRQGWYDLSARSSSDAIFVGGCGRSGTTLVKAMLDRHPRIACGPETSMFGLPFDIGNIGPIWDIPGSELVAMKDQSKSLVEFADAFYSRMLAAESKQRWADKTPNNVRAISELLTWFPQGRFVHVLRDGRDVVCSLRRHPRERVVNGRVVPVTSVNRIDRCARRWVHDTSSGLAFQCHPRVMEVRYEDLVHEPEQTLMRLCQFLGEEYHPCMLRAEGARSGTRPGEVLNNPNAVSGVQKGSVGRWRRDLSLREREVVADIAGELLVATNYAEDRSWTEQPVVV